MNIGIVGFGFVGQAVQFGFAQMADFFIYDIMPERRTHSLEEVVEKAEIIFVCVPTPFDFERNTSDISALDEAIGRIAEVERVANKKPLVVIKSTVVPGTTSGYAVLYPFLRLAFNPEFLTERTSRSDFINPARIIIGGTDTMQLVELYRRRFPGAQVFITGTIHAELVKLICNCFFAVKVSFFNEIRQLCTKLGLDYQALLPMILSDGRIGSSHYEVPGHDGRYGFGGTCFPKDLCATIKTAEDNGVAPSVMKGAWEKNRELRPGY